MCRIDILDFIQFAKAMTDVIKSDAEGRAVGNRLAIEYVRKQDSREEHRVKEVLEERGTVREWIFPALELYTTYQAWHDKKSGRSYLEPDDGEYLH